MEPRFPLWHSEEVAAWRPKSYHSSVVSLRCYSQTYDINAPFAVRLIEAPGGTPY